jgi:hypothetical protein
MNARTLFAATAALWLGGRESALAENEPKGADQPAIEESSPPVSVLSIAASLPSSSNPQQLPIHRSPDFRLTRGTDGSIEQAGGLYTAFGIGMFVASGADLASTELSLARPGIYESNPLQRNRSVRLLTHAAAPAFMYWVSDRVRKNGNPKLAFAMRIGFNVAFSYVVMHNLRTSAGSIQ